MIRPASVLAALLAAGAPASAQVTLNDGGATYSLPVTSLHDIPFRTTVRQQYDYSCGSASLATLLYYHYGVPVTEAEVFKAMYALGNPEKIRKVGFSLLDIKTYLAARGLQSDGFRLTWPQLAALHRPGIAVVTAGSYRHFVVVKGIRGDSILIGDPAQGLRIYSQADFLKIWNGIFFAIDDTPAVKAAFNQGAEWSPFATAPLGQPLSDESLSNFTRELPPIYQVAPLVTSPTDSLP